MKALKTVMTTKGLHLLADFWGCPKSLLEDEAYLRSVVKEAALETGATLRKLDSHKFRPVTPLNSSGVTIYAILAESHISLHTYPSEGFASADIYTCGDRCNPSPGYEYLRRQLRAAKATVTETARGIDT